MKKIVILTVVFCCVFSMALQANRVAYIDVHGQHPTKQGAYNDAWQTAQQHMEFLGYQNGTIVDVSYVQGQTLWHCSMTVRCETNINY